MVNIINIIYLPNETALCQTNNFLHECQALSHQGKKTLKNHSYTSNPQDILPENVPQQEAL